jgi:hypothetical protein
VARFNAGIIKVNVGCIMKKTDYSTSLFWVRHIALALAVVIIAIVVIVLKVNNDSTPKPVNAPETKSVAKGLSDFYRQFRLSSTNPFEDDGGDMVLDLTPSNESLDERLKSMSSNLKPANRRWLGEHKYRTFKAGSTLRDSITAYASQEGMQVIWDLDQDFVIKHQFQMDNTIVGSLAKIGAAIDSNFNGTVFTYVCPQQRSLVITNTVTDYLKQHCSLARPTN